ncbi:docking protein 3 [Electrophorus electricus]|uniref:docking protein 3 n=1 Tax=Electrophorus electricus TaxID=8005 RepID=UPI0015D098A2|nr:docking protein 3 [Electrophorus electricus]
MDTHVKGGEVYLQHQKHSEKWKRYWLNLYPGSRNGVARIELTEAVSERSPVMVRRQPDRKVVRLADCISVVKLPPNAEAHPGGNMAAFCVLTDEKKLVFAVEKEGCGEWVNKICENAFQKGISNAPRQVPHMEENQIYASREEVFEFRVTVQQSEASARCGLWGEFWLQPSEDSLVLKDVDSRQVIMGWPYKLLRRYGRDKVMLSIEAGRRCSSGPGTFNFETVQGDEIVRHMELAIQQQKNGSTFGGSCSPHSPGSPLSRRPYSATLLDTQMNTSSDSSTYFGFSNATYSNSAVPIGSAEASGIKPAIGSSKSTHRHSNDYICLPEPVYSTPADVLCLGECLYAQPIMRSQELSHLRREYEEPVYSEPHDVMQPSLIPQTSVCAHPTNKVKLPITIETHHHGSQPEPVYSEVRHSIPKSIQVQNEEEHIYSLPDVSTIPQRHEDFKYGAVKETKQDTQNKKVDEISVIYSQVNKPRKIAKPQDKSTTNRPQNVMSEDLGLI